MQPKLKSNKNTRTLCLKFIHKTASRGIIIGLQVASTTLPSTANRVTNSNGKQEAAIFSYLPLAMG